MLSTLKVKILDVNFLIIFTGYLGLALKNMGYQIGIMDTDIYGPSIRKMLPEDRLPKQRCFDSTSAMSWD